MMRGPLGDANLVVYPVFGTSGKGITKSGDPLSETLITDIQVIPGVKAATGVLTVFEEVNKNQTPHEFSQNTEMHRRALQSS